VRLFKTKRRKFSGQLKLFNRMHGNESTLAVPSSSVVLPCYCSYIFLPKCFSGLCSLIVGNFYVYARAGIQYFTKLGLYVQGSVAFFGAFPHNIIASITII